MISSKDNFLKKNSDKKYIKVVGAKVHNLKNISISIPRESLCVITGLSGSGKSSLAYDVIYTESNRRYMESLSTHARAIMGVMTKPDVDKIENLSPAIAISQKSVGKNIRSTVGTMTEIYDYLRILFATIGVPHCPETGKALFKKSKNDIINDILNQTDGALITIFAPILENQVGASDAVHKILIDGYVRVRLNGEIITTKEADELVDNNTKVNLDILIDQFEFDEQDPDEERIIDSVQTALKLGEGNIILKMNEREFIHSKDYFCKESGFSLENISPKNFSFNNPQGACEVCDGIGLKKEIDPELIIPNKDLTIGEGAIHMWSKTPIGEGRIDKNMQILIDLAKEKKFSIEVPVKDMKKKDLEYVFYGEVGKGNEPKNKKDFRGIVYVLNKKYLETKSEHMRSDLEKYMTEKVCPACDGKRLNNTSLNITINNNSIDEYVKLTLLDFYNEIIKLENTKNLEKSKKDIISPILREMKNRAKSLIDVGVGYLSLNRSSNTISGGESQRIRLAAQIKSELTGVIYVLDEPTTGLHSKDTVKLINAMKELQKSGNTLIVVEHDGEVMKSSDWIVDMGHGAGEAGGNVVFSGTYKQMLKSNSDTAKYLSGEKVITDKSVYRKGNGKSVTIKGASENNLKNIDVKFPLGKFITVCGVSGSGKSTLVNSILAPELAKKFHRAKKKSGKHKRIVGINNINKVININQSPIGRTPRSNAATYTGMFSYIRELFAKTEIAKEKRYTASRFSFNMKGGRCEECQGEGVKKVEMHLLPPAYVKCDVCNGSRYNDKTLEVKYNGENIANVLDMSVSYALKFFSGQRVIKEKLQTMEDVGLGYLRLGQSATTLSGGEAQRIKLATELARKHTGKTLYILDEPTVGLHFKDIKRLLNVLDALVEKGNTVIVVEHNTSVIKHSDWVIELGKEGGKNGGEIIFEGTPGDLKRSKNSLIANFI